MPNSLATAFDPSPSRTGTGLNAVSFHSSKEKHSKRKQRNSVTNADVVISLQRSERFNLIQDCRDQNGRSKLANQYFLLLY